MGRGNMAHASSNLQQLQLLYYVSSFAICLVLTVSPERVVEFAKVLRWVCSLRTRATCHARPPNGSAQSSSRKLPSEASSSAISEELSQSSQAAVKRKPWPGRVQPKQPAA